MTKEQEAQYRIEVEKLCVEVRRAEKWRIALLLGKSGHWEAAELLRSEPESREPIP